MHSQFLALAQMWQGLANGSRDPWSLECCPARSAARKA
jgi:hypothetical protein